jgi:hypothetical protein
LQRVLAIAKHNLMSVGTEWKAGMKHVREVSPSHQIEVTIAISERN